VAGVKKILIIHGPNLNLLGERDQEIYGSKTLEEIDKELKSFGTKLKLKVETMQSNYEGDIVERIQKASREADCLIINAAAFTHYSLAIRDALESINIPKIEVHISNIYAREPFRQTSIIAPVVSGQISGFGWQSYLLALQAAAMILSST
jgi:3-dehydroquinate dehydratase-2